MEHRHPAIARSPAAGPVKSAARALDLLDDIAANGPGTQLQLSTASASRRAACTRCCGR